ncbi:MAG: V-type ATP synthase subunit F [Clostridia bacterium]|nr:V-type ATP synthase subunit F [Clostridia bacterium]
MHKIGIIGDRNSVLGFMAVGFAVHEVQSAEEAARKISELVASGEYAVIFITEDLALLTEEERAKYKDMPLPAITVIPSSKGSTGYGMDSIKNATLRAVGADILFKDGE